GGRQLRSGGTGLVAVTDDALRRLPKAELHIHLDGSVRPATVEELAREVGVVAADAPEGAAMARVRVSRRAGLLEALAGFAVLLPLLQTKEHLARVTTELVEDLAADGVVYAELRFCPRLNTGQGLTIDEVLACVGEAAAQAEAATGTRVVLLACMMGGVDPAWNRAVLDAAIRRMDAGVVGVDLAGPGGGRTPRGDGRRGGGGRPGGAGRGPAPGMGRRPRGHVRARPGLGAVRDRPRRRGRAARGHPHRPRPPPRRPHPAPRA